MSVRDRHRPTRVVVSRDTLSFLGGWYLIIYQAQFAAQFNLSVFLGGMVITGVPGVLAAWSARWVPIDVPSSGSHADRELER